ncbi:hypothetical protein AYO21_02431 [Fonsecaea monophora]|uniref:Cytochrome P450 monooxygenase n=1 Tax=Fonsecaea monophora TaxID=254056 RepID=A0A177FGQ6_9EURO|nr:hypothetical protein AYO21_02431 [Fonsecaea monophora]OAG43494.1 hypothetical protein AYO21_02431 [Fonsecaea monophora]
MALDVPKPLLLLLGATIQAIVFRSIWSHPFSQHSLMSIFAAFMALDVFAFSLHIVFIYPNFLSPIRHLPTPKGAVPILGHFLTGLKATRGEEYLKYSLETPNEGLIRLRGLFNSDQILVTSPKALAEILVNKPYDYPKPERSREFLRTGLGDGLVVAEGEYHKFQRKYATPSFSFRHVKDLYPLFWDKALKMTKAIEDEIFGPQGTVTNIEGKLVGITDIERWVPRATLDIIGIAGVGRDFNTLENSDDKMATLYATLFTPTLGTRMVAASILVFGHRWTKVLLPSASRTIYNAVSAIRSLCGNFVREKRERIKQGDDESVDVLASLIKADVFSDHELVDELLTILAAGHETTSSTFTWITYFLSRHPDIQSRLRAEVHDALPIGFAPGKSPHSDVCAILESLPLLNGVCQETLRLFPPVPVTLRQNKKDNTLLGQPIAAHTLLTLAPWATNNSPELWGPDAHEFKPERWIDPETGKPNQTGGASTNYAFMTFLHGPRNCIGQQFARAELRALLAAFICMYEWTRAEPEEEVIPAIVITVKPKDGLRLKLTKVRDW